MTRAFIGAVVILLAITGQAYASCTDLIQALHARIGQFNAICIGISVGQAGHARCIRERRALEILRSEILQNCR